ncbi:MAG: TetR/AcrR family transcriptional regulator, partial [Helicobacteraceae bacterium]|nr:TetR/AcrR family transcriptional regulator [Helicobacteraceae bacterium]
MGSFDKKRDLILEAAFTVFLAKGFNQAKMSSIIKAAGGGSLSTIYKRIGSKEKLFIAALEANMADKSRAFRKLCKDNENLDIRKFLFIFGMKTYDYLMSDQTFSLMKIAHADGGRLAHIIVNHGLVSIINVLIDRIKQWQSEGILREGDPFVLSARFFWLTKEPFHLRRLCGHTQQMTREEKTAAMEDAVDFFL